MEILQDRLRGWQREYLRAAWFEGAARFAAWVGVPLLAVLAADALFALPLAARWGAFWALAAAAASGAAWCFVLPAVRMRPPQILRAAARRHPELGPYLLSSWELGEDGDGYTSPALARAHLAQAESLLREAPSLPVFPCRLSLQALRTLSWLGAAFAAAAPILWLYTPGFARVLAPWREVPLESLVEIAPGDKRVVWGSDVTLTARWKAAGGPAAPAAAAPRPLSSLELWLRTQGGSWAMTAWDFESGGAWTYRLQDLTRAVDYQLRLRDQRSRAFALEPIPFPRLADAKVRVHLPGRLAEGDAVSESELSGEVSALRGSWIAVRGRPTARLSSARVRVSYLHGPIEMRAKPSGELEAGFPLAQDGSFQFELVSDEGVSDPHPVAYALRALADEPPTAELLSPAFEVEASPKEPLPVAYEARDDYGVSAVELVYRLGGGREGVVPVRRFAKPPTDFVGEHAWDLSKLPLGERVEFQIRVTDSNRIRPQTALSRKSAVRLVDFDAVHERTEKDWQAAEKALERLAGREAEARRALRALAESASPQERRRLEAAWQEQDRELAPEWTRAAAALKQLAEGMSGDPYANPGMAEAARALGQSLAELAQRELPAASKEARQGDLAGAERRHAGLEEEARRAARMLAQGREVQTLQDFWSESQRMEAAGSELASSLSGLSRQGRKPTEAERRKLEAAMKSLREQMEAMTRAIEALPKPPEDSKAARNRRVYVVPLNAARRTADALQRALEAGDYEAAARLARQLAEDLARVRRAVAEAARAASSGSVAGQSQEETPLSRRMDEALGLWREVVAEQTRSLALTQKLEEEKTRALLDAQERLLERLAERQKAAVELAGDPRSGVPPETQRAMREVLKEFEAKKVAGAPDLLRQTVRTLGYLASAAPRVPRPGEATSQAQRLEDLAAAEQSVLEELGRGVAAPPTTEGQVSASAAAAAVQRQVLKKTADLQRQLELLREESSALTPKTIEPLAEAQQEQGRAASELDRLDSVKALRHEERALELLEQGAKEMARAASGQRSMEAGAARPFESARRESVRRVNGAAGERDVTGADTGFVPLPSAQDYMPPQEIRRDLEESLQERRPRAYDPVIKDYFKRISQ